MKEQIVGALLSPIGRQAIASVVVLALVVAGRMLVLRFVRRNEHLAVAARLRWHSNTRSAAAVLVGLALLFIWGSEVRDLLVSLVVLASAIVLGTKELIMCVSGSIVRATTRSFEVGDRIEVAGLRGDVIDLGVLGTTILEIGPGHQRTGRTLVLPNSLLLSNSVGNETFTEDYVLHTFTVPLDKGADWRAAERRLLAIASDACAGHTEAARTQMDAIGARHGLSSFDVDPRVTVHPETSGFTLRVRIPTPARERGRLEQEVIRRFLDPSDPVAPAEVEEHPARDDRHQP
ncbi:MAG: mechanosensitive ion channel [Sandaracinaceae bacterium]